MRIDPHAKLASLPIGAVRDFLRRGNTLTVGALAKALKLTLDEARRVAEQLRADGLIQRSYVADDEDVFDVTPEGGRFRAPPPRQRSSDDRPRRSSISSSTVCDM